jgi:hypothetical protein
MSSRGNKNKTKKAEVVDSWEDEEVESDEETAVAKETAFLPDELKESANSNETSTNATATMGVDDLTDLLSSHSPFYGSTANGSRVQASTLDKRPEKTMSTANRMIGAALGVRIRQTDEQRKAHKALIEAEKKKRAQEREKKVEDEKAKRSIWEDN